MPFYRKKPVIIEAREFAWGDGLALKDWIGDMARVDPEDEVLYIKTLEGVMKAGVGDYIIKGVNGEFYPCKPDIFHKTYSPLNGMQLH